MRCLLLILLLLAVLVTTACREDRVIVGHVGRRQHQQHPTEKIEGEVDAAKRFRFSGKACHVSGET